MTMLRTDAVAKSYGGVRALDDCSLTVEEGSVTGLIGPNGSGKTTLFNVITGYAKADAGAVYLSGRQITNVSPDKVFNAGIGPDVPADQDLPDAHRAGEHARAQPEQRQAQGHGAAGVRRHREPRQ